MTRPLALMWWLAKTAGLAGQLVERDLHSKMREESGFEA